MNEAKLVEGLEKLLKIKSEVYENLVKRYNISELNFRQIRYLGTIKEESPISLSGLAKKLDLTKPSVTLIVKKFEKLGYVYKEKSDNDARVSYVKMTLEGKMIVEYLNDGGNLLGQGLKKRLSDDDLDKLSEILCKLG